MSEMTDREKAREEQRKTEEVIGRSETSVKIYQRVILAIIIFIIIIWLLFFVFIGITVCPTNDMYPRVDYGDLVLYYRLEDRIKAQDVVVAEKALPESTVKDRFVLRVVAKPGDSVDISDDGRLIINGHGVTETNIDQKTEKYTGFTDYPVTLGEGEYFLLADKRDGGCDSRTFGVVKRDEILGVAITITRRNTL